MIYIKKAWEVQQIKKSAKLLTDTVNELKGNLKAGISTRQLNDIADNFIRSNGGIPAFKDYKGYPESICVSINETVIHGIPSDTLIKKDDLVSIDVGVNLNGYYSDAAFTACINKASREKRRLTSTAQKCLYLAIQQFKVRGRVSDISHAIQQYASKKGYSVVRQFVGHGVGIELHEDPPIPNFGSAGRGALLKPGMIFAIEVMINAGGWEVEILDDGWTTVTKDRKVSAHFEHTVYLSEKGSEILTKTLPQKF